MSIYRDLAERIIEINYLNLDDLESIIKVYFDMWQRNANNQELTKMSIVRKRKAVLAKQKALEAQKCLLERDLLIAEAKIKNNEKVDMKWMARAKLALRIKKMDLRQTINDLSSLNIYEKQLNIKRAEQKEKKMRAALYQVVKDRFGKHTARKMFNETLTKMKQKAA